jgi:hypothetical protein
VSLRGHAFAALRAALLSGDEDAVERAEDGVRIAILSTATADLHDGLRDVLEHGDPVTVAWVRRELALWEDAWGG